MNLVKNGTVLLAALSVLAMTSCGPKEQTIDLAKAQEWLKDADVEKAKKTTIDTQNYKWDFKTEGEGMTPDKGKTTYGFVQYMVGGYIDQSLFMSDEIDKLADVTGNYDHISDDEKDTPITEHYEFFFEADDLDDDEPNTKFVLSDGKLHYIFDYDEPTGFGEGTQEITTIMDYVINKNGFVNTVIITAKEQKVEGSLTTGLPHPVKVKGSFSGTITRTMTYKDLNK